MTMATFTGVRRSLLAVARLFRLRRRKTLPGLEVDSTV